MTAPVPVPDGTSPLRKLAIYGTARFEVDVDLPVFIKANLDRYRALTDFGEEWQRPLALLCDSRYFQDQAEAPLHYSEGLRERSFSGEVDWEFDDLLWDEDMFEALCAQCPQARVVPVDDEWAPTILSGHEQVFPMFEEAS